MPDSQTTSTNIKAFEDERGKVLIILEITIAPLTLHFESPLAVYLTINIQV